MAAAPVLFAPGQPSLFYVAPPDDVPNAFASFWSGFLQTRTPWMMDLYRRRMDALDPRLKNAQLIQIGQILAGLQESNDRLEAAQLRARSEGHLAMTQLVKGALDAGTQAEAQAQQKKLLELEQALGAYRESQLTEPEHMEALAQAKAALGMIRKGDEAAGREALRQAVIVAEGMGLAGQTLMRQLYNEVRAYETYDAPGAELLFDALSKAGATNMAAPELPTIGESTPIGERMTEAVEAAAAALPTWERNAPKGRAERGAPRRGGPGVRRQPRGREAAGQEPRQQIRVGGPTGWQPSRKFGDLSPEQNDMANLIYDMATERGMEHLALPLIANAVAESNLDPTATNETGRDRSYGLFQTNTIGGGLGTGYSKEQLFDPKLNTQLMLDEAERLGMHALGDVSAEDLTRMVTTDLERPADAERKAEERVQILATLSPSEAALATLSPSEAAQADEYDWADEPGPDIRTSPEPGIGPLDAGSAERPTEPGQAESYLRQLQKLVEEQDPTAAYGGLYDPAPGYNVRVRGEKRYEKRRAKEPEAPRDVSPRAMAEVLLGTGREPAPSRPAPSRPAPSRPAPPRTEPVAEPGQSEQPPYLGQKPWQQMDPDEREAEVEWMRGTGMSDEAIRGVLREVGASTEESPAPASGVPYLGQKPWQQMDPDERKAEVEWMRGTGMSGDDIQSTLLEAGASKEDLMGGVNAELDALEESMRRRKELEALRKARGSYPHVSR